MSESLITPPKRPSPDKAVQILQAFLDLLAHPAWITDDDLLILNTAAREAIQQGVQIGAFSNVNALVHDGRRYQLTKSALNHGTNASLCELKVEDELTQRLRDCTGKLDAALKRESAMAPKPKGRPARMPR